MHIEAITNEELAKLTDALDGREAVICAHDNADVDAMLSAEIMRRILLKLEIEAKVVRRTEPDLWSVETICRECLVETPSDQVIDHIPSGAAVILCDWFKIPDAPDDLDVIAVFDHHPTDDDIEGEIVYETRASSTSRVLWQLFLSKADTIKEDAWSEDEFADIAKSALYASVIDTNGLKSTRTDKDDFPWMDEVISEYGLDRDHIIEVGMALTDLHKPLDELIRNGQKNYTLPNGKHAFMSYIIVSRYDGHIDKELREELAYILMHDKAPDGSQLDFAWHLICDLGEDKTHVIKTKREDGNSWSWRWDSYDDNLSRATDVYPMLERENLS